MESALIGKGIPAKTKGNILSMGYVHSEVSGSARYTPPGSVFSKATLAIHADPKDEAAKTIKRDN